MKETEAIQASLLPQYQKSPTFTERFFIAIQDKDYKIERTPNQRGTKKISHQELELDGLYYFVREKNKMEDEFFADLSEKIGKEKAKLFCDYIASEWYDGKTSRNGPEMRSIKNAIKCYLMKISKYNINQLVINHELDGTPLAFTCWDIANILTINQILVQKHITEWITKHPSWDVISNDDIYIRRGLCLDDEINVDEYYMEWDYINSYSLAFSAPEQFSQMINKKRSAIVNGNIEFFNGRILFFSPFIKGMDVGQLEFGIIPSDQMVEIKKQGCFGGILEYIIDSH